MGARAGSRRRSAHPPGRAAPGTPRTPAGRRSRAARRGRGGSCAEPAAGARADHRAGVTIPCLVRRHFVDLRPDRAAGARGLSRRVRRALADGAERGRRPGGVRLAARGLVRRRVLPVRRADLARRPARRAARLDAHGPAPARGRHRRDPAHARPDAPHPAPRHAPHPPHRARRRPVRLALVRGRGLRRRDVALARSRALRRRARALVGAHARAPQLRRRGPAVLVAPALADPLAAAARRHGADRLHGGHEDPRRLPRASCSPSRPTCSTTPTTTPAPAGA